LGGEGLSSKCVGVGFDEKEKRGNKGDATRKIKGMISRYDRIGYFFQCIIPQVDHYPSMGTHILY
jgi:hypothetical protein